ncbi:MAG: cyclase family protein [Vicinamibacterales bacterium]
MCSIKVMSVVEAETARRTFLRSMGAAAVGLGATAAGVRAASQNRVPSQFGRAVHFEKVIDLTHVLEPNIPNYFRLNMEIAPLLTVESNGVYVNRLSVPEHYGTHFDTPAHFIRRGATGESIAPEQLVGPLVIIDIAARASSDPNAEVSVADLERWEGQNGRIPRGAFVAMYSNWAKRWPTAAYLNEDDRGTYNFPGFGGEAARFLIEERDIIGIGCDSHSLDIGPSASYPAHFAVLGAGKIGVENFAGLDNVLRQIERRKQAGTEGHPLIFIGGLKTRGGSGSPIRALALV